MRKLADGNSKKPMPLRVHGATTPTTEWRSVEGETFEEATKKAANTTSKYITLTMLPVASATFHTGLGVTDQGAGGNSSPHF